MIKLPIDSLVPEILRAVNSPREKSRTLLLASPGSGKTTRIPWGLAAAIAGGKVYVLEPRRIAAKLSAERVAAENGLRLGEEVGYHFRFERKRKDSTRLVFLTEGMLLRELQGNPELRGVSTLILDEFHERHLQADLALGIAKRLQETSRPDLRILVMSATLDAGPLEKFLPGCTRIELEAARFPIGIEYAPLESKLEIEVRRKIVDLVSRADAHEFGDLLVFLPGMAEIRKVESEIKNLPARDRPFTLHILHSEIAREEQDLALSGATKRKVILSTNIAESSVTIPGVSTVIDTGLARIASFSYSTGLPRLETKGISRASAIQRAGRAGRTGPGRVVRLYSRGDFEGRPTHEIPEVTRADLAPVLLDLKLLGIGNGKSGEAFEYFEHPGNDRVAAGEDLLETLGFTVDGVLTDWGRLATRAPFHPRIVRALIEAKRLDFIDGAIPALVAILEGERLGVDFITGLKNFRIGGFQTRIAERLESCAREWGNDPSLARVKFGTSAPSPVPGHSPRSQPAAYDEKISRVVLAGFHDRVGRRKEKEPELLMANLGTAKITDVDYWLHSDFHLVLEIGEKKRAHDLRATTYAESAIAVEEEWLWDVEPLPIREEVSRVFDEKKKRWIETDLILFHRLTLSAKVKETAGTGPLSELEWTSLLESWLASLKKGLGEEDLAYSPKVALRTDAEAWNALVIRYRMLREWLVKTGKLSVDPAVGSEESGIDLDDAFRAPDFPTLLRGLLFTNYRDVRSAKEFPGLDTLLGGLWSSEAAKKFRDDVPSTVPLPGRKNVPVHYEDGSPVRIESRIQDFFGLREGPKILGGTLKLSLHLLSPNYRAVQMTEDLSGFWERQYPAVRKEFMRKYPRHKWPEKPV